MKIRTTAARLLGVALLAMTAAAAAQPADRLERAVSLAIRDCPQLTIFDYVASRAEEGGVVVLEGKVTTADKKKDVEQRVARIDGVREVRNQIAVLPASRADEDLRYRISRAIYGNPSFWSYAAMRHPPIHIIVEDGHVTLRGEVHSQSERAVARSLATGQGERSVVNELRTASK
jgi:hyperosmotically inducible periplasmic protein